ncbi:hypothetical protein [Clostridium baratii]|uniref:hypothetical protein n=1 Tax=Clostridium baratii TaxID=1561 RepID=UPI0030CCCD46
MKIYEIREKFYEERKEQNFKKRNEYLFQKQTVLDNYQEAFSKREELTLEGELVLSALVMANNKLFEKDNRFNCPGVFIYSKDKFFEENPFELQKLASTLYELSCKSYDELNENELKIAHMLNDEVTPFFNILLPNELTNSRNVYITSIFIMRKDLRNRYLCENLHPLLIKDGIKGGYLLNINYYDDNYRKQQDKEFKSALRFFGFLFIVFIILIIFIASIFR